MKPAHNKSANDSETEPDKYIQEQDGRIEIAMIGKSASFIEFERPACAGDIVSAVIHANDGRQAKVRKQMRREQVDRYK